MAQSKRMKKAYKRTLYGKINRGRETGREWLIGAHTQNILTLPFNVTT